MARRNTFKTITIDTTKEQHEAITQRAKAHGMSVHKYALALLVDGKLPKPKVGERLNVDRLF